jgi:PKD repeat protein
MSSRVLAVGFVVLLFAAGAEAAPNARFTARKIQGSTCVAPCAVHFDAIGEGANETTDPAFSRPFHSLFFQWDFGDPNSGTWANTGASKNRAIGGMAGHTYETPGNYTVTLRVTNPAGEVSTATTTVNVADANAVFSPANTYCFANTAGNWAGCPLNCSGGDDNCTVTSNWTQLVTAGDNCSGTGDCADADSTPKRILLRRGDTFSSNNMTPFANNRGPGIVGPFGTGNAPVLNLNGHRNDLFGGWTITGLAIRNSGEPIFIQNTIDNVTVHRVDAVFNQNCVNEGVTGGNTRVGQFHAYIELNCTAGRATSYSTWPGANYVLWMGGTFDKRGGSDSTLRSTHMQHYVMQHTRWINAAQGREHWQFRAYDEFANMTPAQEANRWVLISDNVVENPSSNNFFTVRLCVDSGCNCSEGAPQCGGSQYGAGKIVNVADFIFERNFFKFPSDGATGTRIGMFEIQGGDITIRNNVVDYQNAMNNLNASFVVATGEPREHTSGSTVSNNIHVYNNTLYVPQQYTSRFDFTSERGNLGIGCEGGCFARNNMIFGPNFTGQIGNQSPFVGSNNVLVRSNPFATSIPASPSKNDFRLGGSGGTLANTGYTFSTSANRDGWVFDDAFGACRPAASNWDIGAHELGATACFQGGTAPPPASLAAPILLNP